MSHIITPDMFFQNTDLDLNAATSMVQAGLHNSDFGELYQQISNSEVISKSAGRFQTASFGNRMAGFGFRFGVGAATGYSYSDAFNKQALSDAIKKSSNILQGGVTANSQKLSGYGRTNTQLYYPHETTLTDMTADEKIAEINTVEAYMLGLDPKIKHVSITYEGNTNAVHIITADGQSLTDYIPSASLFLSISYEGKDGHLISQGTSLSSNVSCKEVFDKSRYSKAVKEVLENIKQEDLSAPCPAGEMDVVLSPGWSGVLLHEAVGHGLEGDFNRKNISVYSGKIGEKIASSEVTVIDQGDIPNEFGSRHFDDEGTPMRENILIENGVLKGYMQDRQNALLTQSALTGNGRRESYQHLPIPRMTNTYFGNGKYEPDEIIGSVKDGIYIDKMSGGQVNITSGDFNMNATLSYRIRNGKLCEPLKGATLIGDGLSVLQSITMMGNDMKLSETPGACGKDGQSMAVGIGQPTVLVPKMTVGGTA